MLKEIRLRPHIRLMIGISVLIALMVAGYFVSVNVKEDVVSLQTLMMFIDEWGALIGIILTIAVAYLVSLIPSRFDYEVKRIADRLQYPLKDFDSIYAKTIELVDWLNDEPGSEFIMISATPVFGIELSSAEREVWKTKIRQRLVSSGCKTTIICREWQSSLETDSSPLMEFCEEMEKYGVIDGQSTRNSYELYLRSIEALFEFGGFRGYSDFALLCAPRPPVQVILARSNTGKSRGIIYFTSIASQDKGLVVSGFMSEDDEWIGLMREILRYVRLQARDIVTEFSGDYRTLRQKERCNEMLRYVHSHPEKYSVCVEGHDLVVFPSVFPPEIGLGNRLLIQAIRKIGSNLLRHGHDVVGIDIGTGTGILAIELAEFCKSVFATDISPIAVMNARENCGRLGHTGDIVHVLQGNLLDPVPVGDSSVKYLVVFNHPFYPSPLAVYNSMGRDKAGLPILHETMKAFSGRFGDDSLLVMPYSSISDVHNPVSAAHEHNLKHIEYECCDDDGDRIAVYLISKNEKTLQSLIPAETDT